MPSFYYNDVIYIPIVQTIISQHNILENQNIFIHVLKEDKERFGNSIQYRISCNASVEYNGEMFDKVKHYEESTQLSEGMYVSGIIVAKINEVEEING